MRGARWPERRLPFERGDDRWIILHINSLVEGRQTRLVRKELREGDFAFAVLRKRRPEFRHSAIQRDTVLLQDVQKTRAPETLRRRPKKNQRLRGPGRFASGIAKAAVQIEERLAVLPDGNSGAEFSEST